MRLVWVLLLNLVVVFGLQDDPPCEIKDIGGWWMESFQFNDAIDDNHVGKTAEFQCTNVKEVEIRDSPYLTASLVGDVLTFATTEAFKKFEEEEREMNLIAHFYMKCLPDILRATNIAELDEDELAERDELADTEYHLKLTQRINDLNTYEPEFTKGEYIFKYYQDLPKFFDLTAAQRISAEDHDISTQVSYNNLKFTIEDNDYFEVSTTRKDDFNPRLVHAIVKTKTDVKAPIAGSYTITVTDTGKPEAKSSTAKLTVQLYSEETLVFTKPLYQADISSDGKIFQITDGPIAIEGGQDLDTLFEITSDDGIADKFEIKQTTQSITLNLKYFGSLDPELIASKDYLYLTVNANKLGRPGHFAVMIKTNGGTTTTTTTEGSATTPSPGGIETSLKAFEAWIMAGTVLIWISFVLLTIVFLMVIVSFKKYWQKKYKL